MINQYLSVNKSFGSPFVFCLTRRGFYSEINNLLNAVTFGLAHERRLIVDDYQFNHLAWKHLFATTLPVASIATIQIVPDDWYVSYVHSDNFRTIQRWASDRHKLQIPLSVPQMGMSGNLFQIKRELTQMLTRPLVLATFPKGLSDPYAAVHVRRGDKLEGYRDGKNRLIIEGDHVKPRVYIDRLMLESPEIKSIFVMTDDYRIVEEFERVGGDYHIHTFCKPEETGHRQPEFESLDPAQKTERVQRLIAEVQIAAASSIFLGGFKSNVARFVPLWHTCPERCFSVDSQKHWQPI